MKFKKLMAGMLAIITMAVGATGLTSHAEDFSEAIETEEISFSAQMTQQLQEKENAGLLSAEDVVASIEIAESVEEMRNQNMISDEEMQQWAQFLVGDNAINAVATSASSNNYVAYDYYATNTVSTTKHYMSFINTKELSGFSRSEVIYYMNANIFKNWQAENNYKACTGSKFGSISKVSANATSTEIQGWLVIDEIIIPKYTNCVRFSILKDDIRNNSAISSEYDLHRYTSKTSSSPSISIMIDGVDENNLRKCIYSLGDVNRDGTVTSQDGLKAMEIVLARETAGTVNNNINYASSESELAFNLAADVNDDGKVDRTDVAWINQNVLGTRVL
ncbi:MAG: dockerin type I repeat-containing protein [Oscillospiraceae bacterium]|nr:dockerin type I repeat-containing protein [Oscillospiraceae bacterium]